MASMSSVAATMRASISAAGVGFAAKDGVTSIGDINKARQATPARDLKRVIIYPFNNPKKFTSIFSGQARRPCTLLI
jgi:hypothetical protein